MTRSGYDDAPRWYWWVAFRIHGWRREVTWWALMALIGLAAGLLIGRP